MKIEIRDPKKTRLDLLVIADLAETYGLLQDLEGQDTFREILGQLPRVPDEPDSKWIDVNQQETRHSFHQMMLDEGRKAGNDPRKLEKFRKAHNLI